MSDREPIEDGILTRPDVEMLFPSPTNPRKSFDPVAVQELADSIKQFDVMQPILARPIPAAMKEAHGTHAELEIVAGERRWRASQLAGLASVPAGRGIFGERGVGFCLGERGRWWFRTSGAIEICVPAHGVASWVAVSVSDRALH